MSLNRRDFITGAACAGAAMAMDGCRCPFCGERGRVPYGDRIGDRLWMWGHHADSFASMKGAKEQYGLPFDRRIDMAAACREMNIPYSDHNGVKAEFREVLNLCDEITFWFWYGKNVNTIEAQVAKLRELVGTAKPILLGQYMYDFGGKKPLPGADMERQLTAASRLLSQRAIDGVIFHCTPLMDMDLDAVRVSRRWIRDNSGRRWGV